MGTWGFGNLENDGAQDALANICDNLFSEIIELLNHPHSHEYDDEPIGELFVRIEMVLTMSDKEMINSSPDPNILRDLSKSYLKKWADYFKSDNQIPPKEAYENMKESFNQLIKVSGGSVAGSLAHRLGMISKKSRE